MTDDDEIRRPEILCSYILLKRELRKLDWTCVSLKFKFICCMGTYRIISIHMFKITMLFSKMKEKGKNMQGTVVLSMFFCNTQGKITTNCWWIIGRGGFPDSRSLVIVVFCCPAFSWTVCLFFHWCLCVQTSDAYLQF